MADAVFDQADTNHDNRLDAGEFRNLLAQNISAESADDVSGATAAAAAAANSSSSYESSSTETAVAGNLEGSYGASDALEGDAVVASSSYESTASYSAGDLAAGGYESSYSYSTGDLGAAGYGAGGYDGSASYVTEVVGYGATSGYDASSYGASAALGAGDYSSSTTAVQVYATDAQGLFQDSNPQVIRRAAASGPVTYTQNIRVRFLQPPPVPPPGPLIIREVRPPQPPPPRPLVVRQQAPPLPIPPPLVLRERPPVPPQTVATQTVIRQLAALPVPPRSVIIERVPAAPPRPRDIIIERWVPYGAAQKRRTIVQRAAAAQQYPAPRNVIVQYEAPQVRIVRQFQKLGVQAENPQAYVQRYGAQLIDSATLVQQARAAGVVEDISPPVLISSFAATEGQFSSSGGAASELNFEAATGGVESSSNYAYSTFEQSGGDVVGIDSSASGLVFNTADINQDGVLSLGEFNAAGF